MHSTDLYRGYNHTNHGNIPHQCVEYLNNFDVNSYVFSAFWQIYFMLGFLTIVYVASASYFYCKRNQVQFMTRSPITLAISILTLGVDSILNTLIFSRLNIGNVFHW